MSSSLQDIRDRLKRLGNKERAEFSLRYFKTGPGEYGEGARFLGITAPVLRKLGREYRDAPLRVLQALLRSPLHEERSLALLILVEQCAKGDEEIRGKICEFYLRNIQFINSWDLVDLSAEPILGAFVHDKDRSVLYELAKSPSLWQRRMAIIATLHFIRLNDFKDTLRIAGILLADREDLIHKAVGWMLREVGKRHLAVEEGFLRRHYKRMPRTMLRYAIERFPESKRQKYLLGKA